MPAIELRPPPPPRAPPNVGVPPNWPPFWKETVPKPNISIRDAAIRLVIISRMAVNIATLNAFPIALNTLWLRFRSASKTFSAPFFSWS